MPVILKDKIYIPCKFVEEDTAREKYTFRFYDDAICNKCVFRRERHCADCDACEFGGLKDQVSTMSYKVIKGKPYFGFPMGDLDRIEEKLDLDFEELGIKDFTCKEKFSPDFAESFKITMTLYDYQVTAVRELVSGKMGGLQSKPRSGKTSMAVATMVALGYKVVVLANQKDYLDGFARELSEHTNIDALENELGRKLYGFPKKIEDWENFEILLVTYQSLIQDSDTHRWRIRQIQKYRGLTVVDEVHKGSSRTFARTLNQVTSRCRIGLSATFQRKDCRHILVRHILGPIIAKTTADVLKPVMTIHKAPSGKTRAKFTGMGGWSRLTKFLSIDRDRNNYILDAVMRDLDKGRSIAIPVYHVEHAKFLVREINYRYGDEIAAAFLGGTKEAKKRESTIIRARAGEIKVVVGIRSLIQTGINIAAWSCLYNIMPMNNQPNWEQESYRICTPMEGKRTPLIRFFVDELFPQAFGCFKHTVSQSLALGHTLTKVSTEKAEAYGININSVKGDRRYQNNDVGLGRSL